MQKFSSIQTPHDLLTTKTTGCSCGWKEVSSGPYRDLSLEVYFYKCESCRQSEASFGKPALAGYKRLQLLEDIHG